MSSYIQGVNSRLLSRGYAVTAPLLFARFVTVVMMVNNRTISYQIKSCLGNELLHEKT